MAYQRKGVVSVGLMHFSLLTHVLVHQLSAQSVHHIMRFTIAPITITHPAAKGVRQKEFGKKVTKKVTEASETVTKK